MEGDRLTIRSEKENRLPKIDCEFSRAEPVVVSMGIVYKSTAIDNRTSTPHSPHHLRALFELFSREIVLTASQFSATQRVVCPREMHIILTKNADGNVA